MRLSLLFSLLVLLTGSAFAQSTNFPTGPQYLITTDSTLFLRPISTPTLSLSTPLPGPSATPADTPTTEPAAAPIQSDLARILWGAPQNPVNEIELSSSPAPRELPASFFDTGVTGMATAESLHVRGYGIPLGDVAAYWRARKRTSRMFTNADIERLRQK